MTLVVDSLTSRFQSFQEKEIGVDTAALVLFHFIFSAAKGKKKTHTTRAALFWSTPHEKLNRPPQFLHFIMYIYKYLYIFPYESTKKPKRF